MRYENERFTEYFMPKHPLFTWRERRRRAMLQCSIERELDAPSYPAPPSAIVSCTTGQRALTCASREFRPCTSLYRLLLDEVCIEGGLIRVEERNAYFDRSHSKNKEGRRMALTGTEIGKMLLNRSLGRALVSVVRRSDSKATNSCRGDSSRAEALIDRNHPRPPNCGIFQVYRPTGLVDLGFGLFRTEGSAHVTEYSATRLIS